MMVLLDTHAVIWFATEDPSLGKRSRALIGASAEEGQLAICAISFWEIALLLSKGQLQATLPASELRARMLQTGVNEIALSGDIAVLSVSLNLHDDPADRFVAASAITHGATLITADAHLLKWKHALKRQNARR